MMPLNSQLTLSNCCLQLTLETMKISLSASPSPIIIIILSNWVPTPKQLRQELKSAAKAALCQPAVYSTMTMLDLFTSPLHNQSLTRNRLRRCLLSALTAVVDLKSRAKVLSHSSFYKISVIKTSRLSVCIKILIAAITI